VEWRKLSKRDEVALHFVIDQHGLPEALAAVHDAVADGGHARRNSVERLDCLCRLVLGDERESFRVVERR